MTKRGSAGKSSGLGAWFQPPRLRQTISVLMIVGALILLAIYLTTGSDLLGLFSPAEESPTTAVISGPAESAGEWWELYFTDPLNVNDPENLTNSVPEKLIEYINDAQRSIHIAAFEFNLTPVAEALIAAHERGVEVQWVTDDEYGIEADEDEEDGGQFAMLEEAGIDVVDDGRTALMHNKFWIFDGRTVWTGSTNITVNGNFRNNNNVIVIHSTGVAAIFEREFAEMWAGEFGPRSPSTAGDQSATIEGTVVQVLFAAEDDVADHLVPLIEGARESIRFMAFSFTHDEMGAAMLARAEAGVDVQGIFETRGSETEYSEMRALYCAGVPVRQDGNPRTFHHKVIVLDDETVITGSYNFSENADRSNDENVVIVTHGEIAAQYLGEFERRWAEAAAPEAADMDCQ